MRLQERSGGSLRRDADDPNGADARDAGPRGAEGDRAVLVAMDVFGDEKMICSFLKDGTPR